MSKFKVGDKVRVREWNEMERQFGCDEDGDILCKGIFTACMSDFCGLTCEVAKIRESGYYRLSGIDFWNFSDDMLLPANQEEMTLQILIEKLQGDGRRTAYVKENFSTLVSIIEKQKHFTGKTDVMEMMESIREKNYRIKVLFGYVAALYETGYLTKEEYHQVMDSIGDLAYE